MAFDAEGRLIVVDTMNHRVQRFTVEGDYIDGFGTHGSGPGELDMPWGIAIDAEGCLYIGDWRNDRVQKFSPSGELLLSIGSSGEGEGELNRPAGVAVDQHGDIYVADRGNNRVMLFDRDGRYVERFIGDRLPGVESEAHEQLLAVVRVAVGRDVAAHLERAAHGVGSGAECGHRSVPGSLDLAPTSTR